MLGWIKSETSWGNVIGQKSVGSGSEAGSCLFRSLSASPRLGDKDAAILRVQGEHLSQKGTCDPLQGKVRGSFPLLPSPEQVQCATVPCLE